jgi:hypothetical protein
MAFRDILRESGDGRSIRRVERPYGREDVDAILSVLFDIRLELARIRRALEEDDDGKEEEEDDS